MSTPSQICFLCLKQFAQEVEEKSVLNRRSTLFRQFASFASNYLQVNVDDYRGVSDDDDNPDNAVEVEAFCEVCSERVSQVCVLYNELCSVKLRLSTKLEELRILINRNRILTLEATEQDDKALTSSLLKSLAVQLVLQPETVSELRNSILSKFFQKSINRDLSRSQDEIDWNDTEIKEEVESLPDQDDDDHDDEEEEHEELSSEYECSESEGSGGKRSNVGSPLYVKEEMDSEDDMQETEPGEDETGNENENEWGVDDTDHSDKDAEIASSDDDNNESSFEMETDEEKDLKKKEEKKERSLPSQKQRSSPRKITSQRESNKEDFSLKNMFACEANECRLYFTSIAELNAHLKTHSTTIHSCTECNRGFLNPDLLKLHKVFHTKPCRGKYHCPLRSCTTKAHTAKELESHYNINHGLGLGCFKCPKCELNLATERALILHLKKHDKADDPNLPISEPPLCIAAPPCSICGLQFLRLVNLDVHRKKVHKLGVDCPICKKLFNKRSSLRRHKMNYHKPDAAAYICPVCGASIRTKDSLREHIVCLHPEQLDREGIHQCSHCLVRFHRKHLLDDHVKKCERNPNAAVRIIRAKATPCDVCGRLVKGDRYKMRRHLRTHERKRTKPCKKCGLVVEESSFHQHMETHKNAELKVINESSAPIQNEKESFICDICGKEFTLKRILNYHLTRHHGIVSTVEKKFQCHICGNSYSINGNLTKHMQAVHSDEKKFACHLCPHKTNVKMSLKKHLRLIHGKIKGQEFATDDGTPQWRKSRCRYPSCNQEFGEENELKLHVEREHQSQNEKSGTPNFMCSLCGRIFVNQQRLTRHNEVHTQEKRYKCHICHKSLSQPNSLKEHLMAVHGVGKDHEYLSCTQLNCSFKTKSRSHLYMHLRKLHGVYTGKPREKSEGHAGEV